MSDQKTVLIVEDEKNIVDILRFNLQRSGYAILEAYDGEEGLRPVSYTHLGGGAAGLFPVHRLLSDQAAGT